MIAQQGAYYSLLDESLLSRIEKMSYQILKEVGVNLIDDEQSLVALKDIGAKVNGQNIRIDGALLREVIQGSAPSAFTWKGEGSELHIGSGQTYYGPMFGAPNVRRYDNSYGPSNFDDYKTLVKLCERLPNMDCSGFLLCIAHDISESERHMMMLKAHLAHSTKPMMGTILSEEALREVAAAVNATEFIAGECKLLHMINSTPPLTLQQNPLRCLRASSQLGQACMVTSYMMMGATSPVTVCDSLAQGLAEVLVGAALTQLYQPGTAVAGGLFATPFSMSKMLPAFGTMESHMAMLAGIQLIKRLGIPSRGDGLITSAKIHDEQAKNEGINIASAAVLAGADLILHSAGWLENARCVDLKKIEHDMEYLGKMTHRASESS